MGPFLNLSKFLERAVGPPLPCNHLQNLNVPTAVTLWELPPSLTAIAAVANSCLRVIAVRLSGRELVSIKHRWFPPSYEPAWG